MTCPQCNDTGCEPQFVPSGDWYCVLCHVCDPSQPRPVAVELLGDRCETCLGSGHVMEIDRTFFDGGWMPAYVEVECDECNGLGYHPWDDSDDDPDWGAVSERIAARQAADLPSVLLA